MIVPLKVKLEMALMEANKLGLNEVNLEYNPKKLEKLIACMQQKEEKKRGELNLWLMK